jgi:butyrate kinase
MTTGPTQLAKAFLYQRALVARVAGDHSPALAEWGDFIATTAPTARRDDVTPVLAQRLAAISRAGLYAGTLLLGATDAGPLRTEADRVIEPRHRDSGLRT